MACPLGAMDSVPPSFICLLGRPTVHGDATIAVWHSEKTVQSASLTAAGMLGGRAVYLCRLWLTKPLDARHGPHGPPGQRERFSQLAGGITVDVLASPFIRLWNWVDQVGGFPGK